ncbi:JAB domain-containing protein [Daejeonella oryzae]|uniref:JAB domain-containing protein n=1 Tax=Daejeonella oryzae TaxID=1122943 RepID=UPI00041ADE13|nr:JAB domain-containing protein [Daejeonella oryzae]
MENQIMQVAEVQLIYKSKVKASLRPKITKSQDAFEVLKSTWNYETIEFVEEFKMLLLNRANRVLGIIDISLGGTAGTIADPKVIFAAAIKSNACGIILAHNHPSGNLNPSQADIDLTKKLKAGGQLLDIGVLDHIILTSEGFYSFTDEGLM